MVVINPEWPSAATWAGIYLQGQKVSASGKTAQAFRTLYVCLTLCICKGVGSRMIRVTPYILIYLNRHWKAYLRVT